MLLPAHQTSQPGVIYVTMRDTRPGGRSASLQMVESVWEWAARAEAARASGAEYIGPERVHVQAAAAGPKMLDLELQESSCMGRFPRV